MTDEPTLWCLAARRGAHQSLFRGDQAVSRIGIELLRDKALAHVRSVGKCSFVARHLQCKQGPGNRAS
jgi:hypothetical protein